jgi:hypothetical protein
MRLVHVIAASLAALAFAASAARAETVTAGYADAHYAHVSTSGPDADIWGVSGAFSAPLGSTFGLQLDGSWDNVDSSSGGGNFDTTAATAHVFARTDEHLYGALAGVVDSDSSTTWGAGIEGDWYLDNSTVGGRIVYLNNNDTNLDFWGVDAHYRYFVSDNFRLEASAGWGNADFGSDSVDVYAIGGEAEYRMASLPLSIFGDVSYVNADTSGGNSDATIASIGVRWNFNQDSLKDRDRSGPSLKGINSLLGVSGSGSLLGIDLGPSVVID